MSVRAFTTFLLLATMVTFGCGHDEKIAKLKEEKEELEEELEESEQDVEKLEETIAKLEEEIAEFDKGQEEKKANQGTTEIYDLNDFTVNLSGSGGSRILRVRVSVEAIPDAAVAIEEMESEVRDAIILLASDYTTLELEGLDGKLRLRDDIHRRINSVLAPHKVLRVYFTDFAIQQSW